jgi:hypothetical protein
MPKGEGVVLRANCTNVTHLQKDGCRRLWRSAALACIDRCVQHLTRYVCSVRTSRRSESASKETIASLRDA